VRIRTPQLPGSSHRAARRPRPVPRAAVVRLPPRGLVGCPGNPSKGQRQPGEQIPWSDVGQTDDQDEMAHRGREQSPQYSGGGSGLAGSDAVNWLHEIGAPTLEECFSQVRVNRVRIRGSRRRAPDAEVVDETSPGSYRRPASPARAGEGKMEDVARHDLARAAGAHRARRRSVELVPVDSRSVVGAPRYLPSGEELRLREQRAACDDHRLPSRRRARHPHIPSGDLDASRKVSGQPHLSAFGGFVGTPRPRFHARLRPFVHLRERTTPATWCSARSAAEPMRVFVIEPSVTLLCAADEDGDPHRGLLSRPPSS
jgi:hypothetical protein